MKKAFWKCFRGLAFCIGYAHIAPSWEPAYHDLRSQYSDLRQSAGFWKRVLFIVKAQALLTFVMVAAYSRVFSRSKESGKKHHLPHAVTILAAFCSPETKTDLESACFSIRAEVAERRVLGFS